MSIIVAGNESGLLDSSAALLNRDDRTRAGTPGHGEQDIVNVANGNLLIQQRDAYVPSEGDDFLLVRTYNSRGIHDGQVGMDEQPQSGSWTLSTDVSIAKHTQMINATDSVEFYEITYGDGSKKEFYLDASSGEWVSTDGAGAFETLSFVIDPALADPAAAKLADAAMLNTSVAYRVVRADQTEYQFDQYGRLGAMQDTNGLRMEFSYDKSTLTEVRDDAGHVLSYDYYASGDDYHDGKVSTITDETGRTLVTYEYDKNGRLTDVTDRNGHITSYLYDDDGLLKSIELPSEQDVDGNNETYDQRSLQFQYVSVPWMGDTANGLKDNALVVSKMTDAEGGETTFEYNFIFDSHTVSTSIDERMSTMYGGHNANMTSMFLGGNTKVVDALGNNRAYSNSGDYVNWRVANGYYDKYDGGGDAVIDLQAAQIRDAHSMQYAYDEDGYLTEVVDQEGYKSTYEYDAKDNLIAIVDANGYGAVASDSNYYRQIRADLGYTDAAGLGKLAADLTAAEIAVLQEAYTTRINYDDRGNLLSSTDNDDNLTTYTYTVFNKVKSSTSAEGNTLVSSDSARAIEKRDELGYVGVGNTGKLVSELSQIEIDSILVLYTSTFEYDANQNLTKITTAGGDITTFEYDVSGNLKLRTVYLDPTDLLDPTKQQTTQFIYDAFGNNIETVDAVGNRTYSEYDHYGNLTRFIDGNGGVSTYVYDDDNRLLTVTDPESNVTVNQYDAVGNRISVTDANGHTSTRMYDRNNMLIAIIDPEEGGGSSSKSSTISLDRVTSFIFDVIGNNTEVTDAEGRTTTYIYNEKRQIIEILSSKVQDEFGVDVSYSTTFAFDGEGNRIRDTNNRGFTTDYVFTATGLLKQVTDPRGHITGYEYDANSNQVVVTAGLQLTQDKRQVIKFSLDEEDQITATTDAEGAVSKIAYDAVGNVTTTTDANTKITQYEYDKLNRVITQISPDVTDPITGQVTRYSTLTSYDAAGNVETNTDGNGFVTRYFYDNDNRVVMLEDANGVKTVFSYDGNDNRTKVAIGVQASMDLNKQVVIDSTIGAQVTTYNYDEFNQLQKTVDGVGNALISSDETMYVEMRRSMGVTDDNDVGLLVADLSDSEIGFLQNSYATYFTYDRVGNITSETDTLGRTSSNIYDARNRLSQTTNAAAEVTSFKYDGNDNLRFQTDSVGHKLVGSDEKYYQEKRIELGFSADTKDLTQADVSQLLDLNTTEYQYDENDRANTIIDPQNNVTTILYDDFSNIRENRLADFSTDVRVTNYEYDLNNRMTAEIVDPSDLNNITHFEYDAVGNRRREIDAKGNATNYVYDALNRNIKVIDANTLETKFSFDGLSNTVAIEDAKGGVSTFKFDPGNRLVKTVDAEQRVTTYSFDARGNQIAMVDGIGNAIINNDDVSSLALRLKYGVVDAMGNAKLVVDLTPADKALLTSKYTTQYVYDAENNLRSVTDAQGNISTTDYDQVYNVSSSTDKNGNRSTYMFDAVNRMLESVDAAGNKTTYQFDANGNTIAIVNANGNTTRLDYDNKNQLIRETNPEGMVTSYQYNALNNQIQITVADGTNESQQTTFAYDNAGQLKTTIDATGNGLAYSNTLEYQNLRTEMGYAAEQSLLSQADIDSILNAYSSINTYDGNGNVVSSTDNLGRKTEYVYDNVNRVANIIDPIGIGLAESDSIEYQTLRQTLGYAATANSLSAADIAALKAIHTTQYAYDEVGNRFSVTDSVGNTSATYYNLKGELEYTVDGAGYVTQYKYDANGNQIENIRFANAYTGVLDPATVIVLTATPDDQVTRIEYDNLNRVSQTLDAQGYIVTSIYDAAGNVIDTIVYSNPVSYDASRSLSEQLPLVAGQDRQTTYQYDAINRVIQKTDAENITTTYDYDALSNRTSKNLYMASGKVQTTTYVYDDMNRMTDEIYALNANDDYITHNIYDIVGNRIAQTEAYGSADAVTWTYNYDDMNRRVTQTNPEGTTSKTIYDAAGQAVGKIDAFNRINTDARGGPIYSARVYDGASRLISEVSAVGTAAEITNEFVYDAFGNLTVRIDAADNIEDRRYTTYVYDQSNRMVFKTTGADTADTFFAPGGTDAVTMQTVYDAFGNKQSETTGYGTVDAWTTQYAYDKIGQRIATLNGNGDTKLFVYNAFGNMTQSYATDMADAINDVDGAIIGASMQQILEYDGRNLQVLLTNGEYETIKRDYDAAGNLRFVTEAFGHADAVVSEYRYDIGNRMTASIVDPTGLALTTQYEYDFRGNQISETISTDQVQVMTMSRYDEMNRLIEFTDAMGYVSSNNYDVFGNKIQTTVGQYLMTPDKSENSDNHPHHTYTPELAANAKPETTRYSYDEMQRLVFSVDAAGTVSKFDYDDRGNRTGKIEAYGELIDSMGALTDANIQLIAGTDVRYYQYVYDNGNRLSDELQPIGVGNTDQYIATHYEYNGAGQRSAKVDDAGAGNINATSRSYYDDSGRLEFNVDGVGNVTQTVYDKFGNVEQTIGGLSLDGTGTPSTTATTDMRVDQFVYDLANRVIAEVVDPAGLNLRTEFVYDERGNRVASIDANGYQSDQVYDNLDRLVWARDGEGYITEYELDALGNKLSETRYGQAQSLLVVGATPQANANPITLDRQMVYTYDILNRLTSFTDAAGGLITYTYDALGNRTSMVGVKGNEVATMDTPEYLTARQNDGYVDKNGDGLSAADMDDAGTMDMKSMYTTLYTYNKRNEVISETTVDHDSVGVHTTIVTSYDYDAMGNKVSQIYNAGSSDQQQTSFGYDKANRGISMTNAFGNALVTSDKAEYIALRTQLGKSPTAAGLTPADVTELLAVYTSRTEYNGLSKVSSSIDVRGYGNENVYDNAGRLTQTINAEGVDKIATSSGLSPTQIDAIRDEYSTYYVYDSVNNRTQVIQSTGSIDKSIVTTYYDKNNESVLVVDGEGGATVYEYDGNGNTLSIISYDDKLTLPVDADIYPTLTASALGRDHVSYFQYDGLDRVTYSVDGEGYMVRTNYDAFGNTLSTYAFSNKPTTFDTTLAFDTQEPTVDVTKDRLNTMVYDTNNYKMSQTDAAGYRVDYSYDTVGNVLSKVEETGTALSEKDDALFIQMRKDLGYVFTLDMADTIDNGDGIDGTDGKDGPDANVMQPVGSGLLVINLTQTQKYELRELYTTYYQYDDVNRLTQETDYEDNVTTYTYDISGNRTSTVTYVGTSSEIRSTVEYDVMNRAVTNTEAAGTVHETVARHVYNAQGQMVEHYDGFGATDPVTGASIQRLTISEFGANGLVSQSTSSMGTSDAVTTQYEYDGRGNLGNRIDAVGTIYQGQTRFIYDGNNRISFEVKQIDNTGKTAINYYGYDAHGNENVVAVGSGMGVTNDKNATNYVAEKIVEYIFNGKNQLSITQTPYLDKAVTGKDVQIKYEYDAFGNKEFALHAFNFAGDPDQLVRVTEYEYDILGQIVKVTDPVSNVTSYTYNAAGDQLTKTDPNLRVQVNTFDSMGRSLTSLSTGGILTVNAFDLRGNITAMTQSAADGITDAQTTRYEFDLLDRQIRVTDFSGYSTSIVYDLFGNQIQVSNAEYINNPLLSAAENASKAALAYPTSNSFTYDSRDRMTSTTDGLGYVTTYEYNAQDDRTTTIDAIGNGLAYSDIQEFQDLRVAKGYSALVASLSQAEIDTLRAERTSSDIYDFQGRVVLSLTPEGGETTYTYNGSGDQLTKTNSNGNAIVSSNDPVYQELREALGYPVNLTATSLTDAQKTELLTYFTTRYEYYLDGSLKDEIVLKQDENTGAFTEVRNRRYYDVAGNENKVTEALGSNVERSYFMTYDANNRKIEDISGGGNVTRYQYDALGNRTEVIQVIKDVFNTDPTLIDNEIGQSVARFYFDVQNRLIAILDPMGYVTAFSYDTMGNKTNESVYMTAYTGDPALFTTDMIPTLAGSLDKINSFEYDDNNRQILKAKEDGTVIKTVYDAANNVTAEIYYVNAEQYASNNARRSYYYQQDLNNRVIQLVDSYLKLDGTSDVTTTTFTYDAANNKIDERIYNVSDTSNPERWSRFSYDNNNREIGQEFVIKDPVSSLFVLGGANNIVQKTEYDQLANVTTKTSGRGTTIDKSTSYVYDANNMVIEEVSGTGGTIRYVYDSRNNMAQSYQAVGWGLLSSNEQEYSSGRTQMGLPSDFNNLTAAQISNLQDGYSTVFTYNGNNQKITERGPVVDVFANERVAGGVVSSGIYKIDSGRPTQQWTYDALGNEVQHKLLQADLGGNTQLYQTTTRYFDANNRMVAELDANNTLRTFTYNATGDEISKTVYMNKDVVTSNGATNEVAFADADHKNLTTPPVAGANATMRVYTQYYDVAGRMTKMEYPAVDISTLDLTDPASPTSSTQTAATLVAANTLPTEEHVFDVYGNEVMTTDKGGKITLSYFDNKDRMIAQIDSGGYLVEWVFDSQDNVLRQITHSSPFSDAEIAVLITEMNASLATGTSPQLLSSPLANGVDTLYSIYRQYDEASNMLLEMNPPVEVYDTAKGGIANTLNIDNQKTAVTTFEYDADKNVIKKTIASGTSLESSEYYFYNQANQKIAIINADNVLHFFAYDAAGNRTVQGRYAERVGPTVDLDSLNRSVDLSTTLNILVNQTAGIDQTKVFQYNAANQKVFDAEIDGGNTYGTRFLYDLAGNKSYSKSAKGGITRVVFNALNQPILTIKADGSTTGAAFDAVGNQILGFTGYVPNNETSSVTSGVSASVDGGTQKINIGWNITEKASTWDTSNGGLLTINSYVVYDSVSRTSGIPSDYANSSNYAGAVTSGSVNVNIAVPDGDSTVYFRVVTQDLAGNTSWSQEYSVAPPASFSQSKASFTANGDLQVSALFSAGTSNPRLIYLAQDNTVKTITTSVINANGENVFTVSDEKRESNGYYALGWRANGVDYVSSEQSLNIVGNNQITRSEISVVSTAATSTDVDHKVSISSMIPASLSGSDTVLVARWREQGSSTYKETANTGVTNAAGVLVYDVTLGLSAAGRLANGKNYIIELSASSNTGETVALGSFVYSPNISTTEVKESQGWKAPEYNINSGNINTGTAALVIVDGVRNSAFREQNTVAVGLNQYDTAVLADGAHTYNAFYTTPISTPHTTTITSSENAAAATYTFDVSVQVGAAEIGKPMMVSWRSAGSGAAFTDTLALSTFDAVTNTYSGQITVGTAGLYDIKTFYDNVIVDWARADTTRLSTDPQKLSAQYSQQVMATENGGKISVSTNATGVRSVSATPGQFVGEIGGALNSVSLQLAVTNVDASAGTSGKSASSDTGYIAKTEYNALDVIINETKQDGIYREYKVDASGNVIETQTWGTEAAKSKPGATARVSYAEYDNRDRKVAQYDPKFKVYNSTALGGLEHPITRYEYDFLDNVIRETSPSNINWVTEREFNALGKKTSETIRNTGGIVQKSFYEYDIRGNEVAVIHSNSDRSENRGEVKVYNKLDQMTSETQGLLAGETAQIRYEYDSFGRREYTDTYYGRSVSVYDQRNNLIEYQQAYDTGSKLITYYKYDSQGNRIETIDPRWALENNGTQETTRYKVRQEFDSLDRVIATRSFQTTNGTAITILETRKYDVFGNVIEERKGEEGDIAGTFVGETQTKGFVFGEFARIKASNDSTGLQIRSDYDDFGKVTFEYDATEASSLANRTTRGIEKNYDSAGNLVRIFDHALNVETVYEYDIAGNKMYERTTSGIVVNPDTPDVFKAAQELEYTYGYDSRNNMVSWSETGSGMNLTYNYDFTGNLQNTKKAAVVGAADTDKVGLKTINNLYKYDSAGRLLSISGTNDVDNSNRVIGTYTYNDAGDRNSFVDGINNNIVNYNYYENSRIKTGSYYDKANDLITQSWLYDGAGNVTTYTENKAGELSTNSYQYSENNKNWRSEISGKDNSTSTYNFNAYGQSSKLVKTQSGSTYTYTYQYTKDGRETGVTARGDALGQSSSSYDVNYNRTAISLGKGDNGTNEQSKFIYDNEKQIIARTHTNSDNISDNNEYFYANGNSVGEISYTHALDADDKPIGDQPVTKVLLDEGKYNLVEQINDSNPSTGINSYTTNEGDSLQSIAAAMYGNSSLWYILAEANGLNASDRLTAGLRLSVPTTVQSGKLTSEAVVLYNDSDIIGSTLPNLEAPPPPKSGGGCGSIIMTIIVIVIAVVAAAFIGPLALGILGAAGLGAGIVAVTLAYAVAGAIVYAAANIVQQGLFIAMGFQESFDWDAVGDAAVTGAFTGAASGFAALGQAGKISQTFAKVASASAKVLAAASKQYQSNGKITSWTSLASAALSGAQQADFVDVGAADGALVLASATEKVTTTLETIGEVAEYVTPWLQLAETYIRNDGELTPSDWAGAVSGTLLAVVGDFSEGIEGATGLNDVAQRLAVNALVAGALSNKDPDAARKFMYDAVGNEIGTALGKEIVKELQTTTIFEEYNEKLKKEFAGGAARSAALEGRTANSGTNTDKVVNEKPIGNEQAKKVLEKQQEQKAKEPVISSQKIQSGDSLWNIAKSQLGANASDEDILRQTQVLMQLNPDLDPSNLKVGAKLNLVEPGSNITVGADTQARYTKEDQGYQKQLADEAARKRQAELDSQKAISQSDETTDTPPVVNAPEETKEQVAFSSLRGLSKLKGDSNEIKAQNGYVQAALNMEIVAQRVQQDDNLVKNLLANPKDADGKDIALLTTAGLTSEDIKGVSIDQARQMVITGLEKRANGIAGLATRVTNVITGKVIRSDDKIADFLTKVTVPELQELGRTSLTADLISFIPFLGNAVSAGQAVELQLEKNLITALGTLGVFSPAQTKARLSEANFNTAVAAAGVVGGAIGKGIAKAAKAGTKVLGKVTVFAKAGTRSTELLTAGYLKTVSVGGLISGTLAQSVAKLSPGAFDKVSGTFVKVATIVGKTLGALNKAEDVVFAGGALSKASSVGNITGKAANASDNIAVSSSKIEGTKIIPKACFVAGTMIQTDKGLKAVETFRGGEQVLSRNELNGETTYKTVVDTRKGLDKAIYRVSVVDDNGKNEYFQASDNHPFWLEGTGWVQAVDLLVGNRLTTPNGVTVEIVSLELEQEKQTVYNIEVEDFHTYFIGELNVFVHNADCAKLENGQFRDANGRVRDADGKFAKIEGGVDANKLGFSTTTDAMRKAVQGKQYRDPLTNKLVSPKKGEVISPDHIYPVSKIRELPGFDKLSKNQQKAIVRDTVGLDNIQPLPKSFNESKGNKINGKFNTYKNQKLDATYVNNLRNAQDAARNRIQIQIDIFRNQN